MTITKDIDTEFGAVRSTAEILRTDAGLTVIKVSSNLQGAVHEHTVTCGSKCGIDQLQNLTAEHLQSHLDEVRQKSAEILAARRHVHDLASQLK
jgi:hypothetical protein